MAVLHAAGDIVYSKYLGVCVCACEREVCPLCLGCVRVLLFCV